MWRVRWHQTLCCTPVQFIPCDIPQVHCRGDVSTVGWSRLVSLMGLRRTGGATMPLSGLPSSLNHLLAPICQLPSAGCPNSSLHCSLCMRLLTGALQRNLSRDNSQVEACLKLNVKQFVSDKRILIIKCGS